MAKIQVLLVALNMHYQYILFAVRLPILEVLMYYIRYILYLVCLLSYSFKSTGRVVIVVLDLIFVVTVTVTGLFATSIKIRKNLIITHKIAS